MASIASWIYDKPLRGNYTFTHDEVAQAFPDMSAGSIARALTREVSKGRIMSPLRGFYVIVPDEYVLRGAVPQSFYLDDMMHHLGRKYYVALLSAASYHGASHQVPLRFSVMIEPPAMRDKKGKKYLTHYFCKSHIPEAYVERRQTRTGYINVSCPELTAVDLLTYQAKTGSISRAATVLAELVEKLDFDYIMNSQALWGCFETVKGLRIAELRLQRIVAYPRRFFAYLFYAPSQRYRPHFRHVIKRTRYSVFEKIFHDPSRINSIFE